MNLNKKLKDFEKEYREKGAYHFSAKGFYKWWLEDNYRMLCACVSPKCRTLLDLGCGDGRLQDFTPSTVHTIFGVDYSPAGIKHAQKQKKYHVLQADMKALPFKENTFETIVSSVSLQYLAENDLQKAFGDIYFILKQNGQFIFSYRNASAAVRRSTDAALPLSYVQRFLGEAGFNNARARGICLLNPPFLVSLSAKPFLSIFSRAYYLFSRIAYFFPKRSYHYVVSCVKTKR